jgi:hypothetical protein
MIKKTLLFSFGLLWAALLTAAPNITLTTIWPDTSYIGPFTVRTVVKDPSGLQFVALGFNFNPGPGNPVDESGNPIWPFNGFGATDDNWIEEYTQAGDTFYFDIPAIPQGLETPVKVGYCILAYTSGWTAWRVDPPSGYYSFFNTIYTPSFTNVTALRDTFYNGPFTVRAKISTAYGDSVKDDIVYSDIAGGNNYPRDSISADSFYYYSIPRHSGGTQTPQLINWFLTAYDTLNNWAQWPVKRDTMNHFTLIDPWPSNPRTLSNTSQTGPFPVWVSYKAEGPIINDSLWIFNGSSFDPYPRDSLVGNTYYYTIPQQNVPVINPVTVQWYLKATDSLTGNYTFVPETAGPPTTVPYTFRIYDWTGPQVTNATSLENDLSSGPFEVTANCRDTSGISQVRVYFRAKPSADTAWSYLPMFATGSPDQYKANIPVQSPGQLIQYYFQVRDGALNEAGTAIWNSAYFPAGGVYTPAQFYTGSPDYRLLLVNDALAVNEYGNYYASCLDTNGVVYGMWDNRKDNVLSWLHNFNTVIWFTGDDSTNTLTLADRDSLIDFLDRGGKLLLSSKNLGQDLLPDTGDVFFKDYLKASLVATNSTNYFLAGQPNSLPFTYGATESLVVGGAGGANNRYSMDKLKPLAGADSIFTFKPSGSSGVIACSTAAYQTVFCSVPVEALTKDRVGGRMARTVFIGRVLKWFGIQTFYKVEGEEISQPGLTTQTVVLNQAYPNPFSQNTVISFNLPAAGQVSLKVYNVLGQAVKTICNEQRPAGLNKMTWSGHDESGNSVSNGIYLYRLVTEGQSQTRKVLLVR